MSESHSIATERDPLRNPSYPQRVHIHERAEWLRLLAEWDKKIEAARGRMGKDALTSKAYAQMSGARDQIAESVRRLPMEVGEMYAESKHRLEEAVAALERLIARV